MLERTEPLPQRVLNGAVRALARGWLMVWPLVLALMLVRIGQTLHFWPSGYSVPNGDVALAWFQGGRFDLKVSAIAAFVLLLVLPWIGVRAYRALFGVVAVLFVLLGFINLHYFGFYKNPIDSLVFGIAEDDTNAVLKTILHDFPVLTTLLLVAALSWSTVRLHGWLVRRVAPDTVLRRQPAWARGVFVFVAFWAMVFAGKGTLREMALQRQHLTITTSQYLNDMVPNGVIALKYAWDSRRQSQNLQDPLLGVHAMGFDNPRAAAQVLGLPHADDAQVAQALIAHPPLATGQRRKNLLFFLMESWSAEPMLYQAPHFDVLGRLAPTLDKACHFSNFDSAQAGTHPSLEAILFSTPITPLTLGDIGRHPIPWSVAKIARDAGYHTMFVSSVRAGWRELDRMLKAQGFDEVVDANSLKEMYPEATLGLWGVWDDYVFRYLSKRVAAQPADKPLFVFTLTSTNHPPYDLPPQYKRVPRDMSLWKGETSADTLMLNLDTYHYAADLLGGFVQGMQHSPQWPNTIIAATGDHNVRSFGVYADPARRYLMRQVPFVVWGEGLQCGQQLALPASHRDMFPTLFPLAGIDGPYVNSGRNLMLPPGTEPGPVNAPRAMFFTGEARNAQGMWQLGNPGSFVCTAANGDAVRARGCQFNAQDDQQERARYALLDWNVRMSLKKK